MRLLREFLEFVEFVVPGVIREAELRGNKKASHMWIVFFWYTRELCSYLYLHTLHKVCLKGKGITF